MLCDLVEGGVLATHPQHAGRKQVGAWCMGIVKLCFRSNSDDKMLTPINRSSTPSHATTTTQHIPVYSSNSDLVFSSTYSVPRLAQGSFIEAWKHVYKTCYDGPDIEVRLYFAL